MQEEEETEINNSHPIFVAVRVQYINCCVLLGNNATFHNKMSAKEDIKSDKEGKVVQNFIQSEALKNEAMEERVQTRELFLLPCDKKLFHDDNLHSISVCRIHTRSIRCCQRLQKKKTVAQRLSASLFLSHLMHSDES